MNKRLFYLCAIWSIGLFLGALTSKTYLDSDQYRALRISNLFERMCLQEFDWQTEKQRPSFFSLQSLNSEIHAVLAGSESWTDQRSKAFIRKSENGSCSVLITEPFVANSAQASRLVEHIHILKNETYPALVRDPGMDAIGPFVVGWFKGEPNTPQRWGIFLFTSKVGDGGFSVALSYRPPPSERD